MTRNSENVGPATGMASVGDRAVPNTATFTGRSPDFDRDSVPEKLLEDHVTKTGTWGRLVVLTGEVHYHRLPSDDVTVPAGHALAIPPGEHHSVTIPCDATFFVEFWQNEA